MHILITGGTGLIGSAFISRFADKYQFTLISRQANNTNIGRSKAFANLPNSVAVVATLEQIDDFTQFDAVINLQGENLFAKRWNDKQINRIETSRWEITEALAKRINACSSPPKVFISGSAIGYYGRQQQVGINETYSEHFPEFSHHLCKQWEQKALIAKQTTRVCLLRTGIVLSKGGGALAQMLPSFNWGMGAKLASGHQVMSWIHISDMINAIDFVLTCQSIEGVVNMTSPTPCSNADFCHTLAKQLQRPCFFTIPAFMLKLLLGEVADLLIYGQDVVPNKLKMQGFQFNFPKLAPALQDLLG